MWLKYGYYFGLFVIFVFLSLIFQSSGSFYELGAYKNYLISILNDFDFNIINQVNAPANWLITKNYFHPDHHSEIFTGPLSVFYFLEKILTLGLSLSESYRFYLGFSAFNFFCLFLGFYFNLKTLEKLNIRASPFTCLVFFLSTALFYYSIFWSNVTDIFLFLLTSYIVNQLVELDPRNLKYPEIVISGFCISYLIIFRPMNCVLGLLFLYIFWKSDKRNKAILSFVLSIISIIAVDAYLKFLKFSIPVNPSYASHRFISDSSFHDMAWSFIWGFFGPIGIFVINISYFLGLCGLVFFLVKRKKTDFIFSVILVGLCLFVIYLITMLGMYMGPLVEDQFPGRLFINIAPFLFIGFAILWQGVSIPQKRILGIFLVGLHLLFFTQYYLIAANDYYQYSNEYFLNMNTFLKYLAKARTVIVNETAPRVLQFHVALIFISLSGIVFFFLRKIALKKMFEYIILASTAVYILMVAIHLGNYQKNISKMKDSGVFENSSVANGAEAFGADYILDAAKRISYYPDLTVQNNLRAQLKLYFVRLRSQIQTNDPDIVKFLQNENFDLSFLVREEKARVKSQSE